MITLQVRHSWFRRLDPGYNVTMSRTTDHAASQLHNAHQAIHCPLVPASDDPSWRAPSEIDVAVGRALEEARFRIHAARPRIVDQIPGMTDATYRKIEAGKQRVTVGAMVAIARACGTTPTSILVGAGLDKLTVDVVDAIQMDPTLDELGRQLVVAALRSARQQTAERAGSAG